MTKFAAICVLSVVGGIFFLGCSDGRTPEERHQQRITSVSQSPHIKKGEREYTVSKILDDLPDATLVRVVLTPMDTGPLMVALHPRCEPLVVGQKVGIVFADYRNSEYNNDPTFYIKVD